MYLMTVLESRNGLFPAMTFPRQTLPRRTVPRQDFSPLDYFYLTISHFEKTMLKFDVEKVITRDRISSVYSINAIMTIKTIKN